MISLLAQQMSVLGLAVAVTFAYLMYEAIRYYFERGRRGHVKMAAEPPSDGRPHATRERMCLVAGVAAIAVSASVLAFVL